MNHVLTHENGGLIPPECVPTLTRVQAVLDGDATFTDLAADAHPALCARCRGRVRAARVLLASMSRRADSAVPAGLTASILAGVRADGRARRRAVALVGGLATAAAVVVAVWVFSRPATVPEGAGQVPAPAPAPAVIPVATPPTPVPPAVRIDAGLDKAGDALRESSRVVSEPLTAAPGLFAAFPERLVHPPATSLSPDIGPIRKSLTEIPEAARTGLEPVTGSALKAYTRFVRDVSAVTAGRTKS